MDDGDFGHWGIILRDPQHVSTARKKPVQKRSRSTVASLLDATAHIIASGGEHTMTSTAIAEKAGYSIGTFYQYFPDVDAVLVALIEREREMLLDGMQTMLQRSSGSLSEVDLREYFRFLIDWYKKLGTSKRRRLLLIALQDTDIISVLRIDIAQMLAAYWHFIAPDRAQVNDINAFVLAQAVWGALHTAALSGASDLEHPAFEEALYSIAQALSPPEISDTRPET